MCNHDLYSFPISNAPKTVKTQKKPALAGSSGFDLIELCGLLSFIVWDAGRFVKTEMDDACQSAGSITSQEEPIMSKTIIAVSCLILLIALCVGAALNARIAQHRSPNANAVRAQSIHAGHPAGKSFSPREYIRIVRQSDE